MKQTLIILLSFLAITLNASAQVEVPKDTPQLEFVMQLKVTLGEAYSCGETRRLYPRPQPRHHHHWQGRQGQSFVLFPLCPTVRGSQ